MKAHRIDGPSFINRTKEPNYTLIELVLEEETARFIKDMVQNPLQDNEDPESRDMREKIFSLLKDLV